MRLASYFLTLITLNALTYSLISPLWSGPLIPREADSEAGPLESE